MKTIVAAIVLTPALTWAADEYKECFDIKDAKDRVSCYDKALGNPKFDENVPAENQPKPKPDVQFYVNDEGKVDTFAGVKMGSKAATLSADHTDGQSYASAKIGVIAIFRPISDAGWQPFAGAAWVRDAASKNPKDVRDLSLGIVGAIGAQRSVGVIATPRILRRTDIFGHTSSSIVQLHGNILVNDWLTEPEAKGKNLYSLIPQVGLQLENRASSKVDNGGWRGSYVGLLFDAKLNSISPQLGASVQYQFYRDFKVPTGNARRSDGYANFQISYDFTNPDDKSIHFRPSIVLSRQVGVDPISGVNQTNTTKLSLGLKVD